MAQQGRKTGLRRSRWDDQALSKLIAGHLARHRTMAPGDAYKRLYQGVLGPEHLVRMDLSPAPEAGFADRLRAEYAVLTPEEDEPLWEAVHPDGELGRINLRPFKARGGDLERLIAACWQTARRWEEFPLPEVLAFAAWLEEQEYPAIHHSPAYRAAHRPAYGLLARSLWPEMTK